MSGERSGAFRPGGAGRAEDSGRRPSAAGAYHRPRQDTHVLINASPIVADGGEIIGGVATEQDITHLVKLNDELGAAQSRLLTHKMSDRDPFALLHARGESMGKVVKIAKKSPKPIRPCCSSAKPARARNSWRR